MYTKTTELIALRAKDLQKIISQDIEKIHYSELKKLIQQTEGLNKEEKLEYYIFFQLHMRGGSAKKLRNLVYRYVKSNSAVSQMKLQANLEQAFKSFKFCLTTDYRKVA